MKKTKGISTLALLLIIAIIIAGVYFFFKYFPEPVTEVLTGGARQSLPALDTAKKVGDKANKAVQATDEATKKLDEDMKR